MLLLTGRVEGKAQAFLREIAKQYAKMKDSYVVAGWDSHAKYPTGQLVAQVAIWNEFGTYNADGTPRNPARPFIRPAYQDNQEAIKKTLTSGIQAVTDNKSTAQKALESLGYKMVLFIQEKIKANPRPENAASTAQRKRDAGRPLVTLIDTRRMLDTVTYKVYLEGETPPPPGQPPPSSPSGNSVPNTTSAGDGVGKVSSGGGGKQIVPRPVRDASAIKKEKTYLQDELKKAQRKKKEKAPPQTPKSDHGKGGRGKKEPGGKPKPGHPSPGAPKHPRSPGHPSPPKPSHTPTQPKLPKAPRAPKQPRAPKSPRVPKAPREPRQPKAPPTPRAPKPPKAPGAPRPSKPVKPNTVTTPGNRAKPTVRHTPKPRSKPALPDRKPSLPHNKPKVPRKTTAPRRDVGKVASLRKTKMARAAHNHSFFTELESTLLQAVIHLARKSSTYGRNLI